MQLRSLAAGKLIAIVLLVLVLLFDSVTYYYQRINGTSITNLAIFDGVISLGALILVLSLWSAPTLGRTIKLTFVAAVVLFFLTAFVTPFSTPFTELVAYFLLFGALAITIAGIFMRMGN
jgi:hypothetical protein